MPRFTLSLDMGVLGVPVTNTRIVERGRLKSLSVFERVNSTSHCQTYLICGTCLGVSVPDTINAVFFAGYVSRWNQPLYMGDYPFSPAEIFFVQGRSMVNLTLEIIGVTELGDP